MKKIFDSEGVKRPFSITFGLQEGYGDTGKVHSFEEAVDLLKGWMKERASKGLPFLTGNVFPGQVVYAWSEGKGEAQGASEPVANFQGEVSVLYARNLPDEEVQSLLDEIASSVGTSLGQNRVYVSYKDKTWILSQEDHTTPTGN